MIKVLWIILCTAMLSSNTFASMASPVNAPLNDNQDLKAAQTLLASGDYDSALDKYHTAAVNRRHPLAQFTLVLFYQNDWGHAADRKIACEWFEQAEQLNSYCHLGNFLMTGNEIAKNPFQALKPCRPAALQGSTPMQIWMDKFYLYGDSSVCNPQDTYQWSLAAAQKQFAWLTELETARLCALYSRIRSSFIPSRGFNHGDWIAITFFSGDAP